MERIVNGNLEGIRRTLKELKQHLEEFSHLPGHELVLERIFGDLNRYNNILLELPEEILKNHPKLVEITNNVELFIDNVSDSLNRDRTTFHSAFLKHLDDLEITDLHIDLATEAKNVRNSVRGTRRRRRRKHRTLRHKRGRKKSKRGRKQKTRGRKHKTRRRK